MVNDRLNINRANVILNKIQRILCKNNPNGRTNPDAEENNDKKGFVMPLRNVRPEDVKKEMVYLRELFDQLAGVVENIENIETKTMLEDKIDTLENTRRDIRNENQDKINVKRNPDGQAVADNNRNTFLKMEGGGSVELKDWT